MDIQELSKYKVRFIKTKTGMTKFGQAKDVVDEGRLFRIAELHVVWKADVINTAMEGNKMIISFKNGETVEIGIIEK